MTEESKPFVAREKEERREWGKERRVADGDPPSGEERRSGERRKNHSDRRGENNLLFSTFFIGDSYFGIPVDRVQEVQPSQGVTPVPLAKPYYKGLINLRGQIVPALDMGLRLYNKGIRTENYFNIIVHIGNEAYSLVAERIGDIEEVYPHLIESPPANLGKELNHFVESVCKLEKNILVILNVDRLAS